MLHYELHDADYLRFQQVIQAEQRRRRPLRLALMAALTGGVLLASAEPWRTAELDVGMVALAGLFSLALVAVGLAALWMPPRAAHWLVRRVRSRAPLRMPSGPVTLGLGPEGGWVSSGAGVSEFGWRELNRVHSDADLVVLLFSDQVGVIVPSHGFDPPHDQDAVVADIERWQFRSRNSPPSGPQPPARTEAAVGNPFEPPSGE